MTAEIFKTELLKLLAFVSFVFSGIVQADDIAIVNARIVTMDDATLVAPKRAEERVREVVKRLEEEQRTDLL